MYKNTEIHKYLLDLRKRFKDVEATGQLGSRCPGEQNGEWELGELGIWDYGNELFQSESRPRPPRFKKTRSKLEDVSSSFLQAIAKEILRPIRKIRDYQKL